MQLNYYFKLIITGSDIELGDLILYYCVKLAHIIESIVCNVYPVLKLVYFLSSGGV